MTDPIVQEIADMNITLEEAINNMEYEDYNFYILKRKRWDDLRGALGELIGYHIMKKLAEKYPIQIEKGDVANNPRYYLQHRIGDENLLLHNTKTLARCDIDNLFLYKGRPYIIESKVGTGTLTPTKKERQKKFVEDCYETQATMIELRINRVSLLMEREPGWYLIKKPLGQEITAEVISQFGTPPKVQSRRRRQRIITKPIIITIQEKYVPEIETIGIEA